MITWEIIEKEFGIKFTTPDGQFRSVVDWLQDVYEQNPSCFEEMMSTIFYYGDALLSKEKK